MNPMLWTALAVAALGADKRPILSVDEVVRVQSAVTTMMTLPTPDALAIIQQLQRLTLDRLGN